MLPQNHELSRLNISIRSNQLTKMPVNSGTMIAHRNGLLCDHAEHSSSQPTVGNAHNAYTGIHARVPAAIVSGLAGSHSRVRSEEHTSELKSLMRISYAVFCLKKKTT